MSVGWPGTRSATLALLDPNISHSTGVLMSSTPNSWSNTWEPLTPSLKGTMCKTMGMRETMGMCTEQPTRLKTNESTGDVPFKTVCIKFKTSKLASGVSVRECWALLGAAEGTPPSFIGSCHPQPCRDWKDECNSVWCTNPPCSCNLSLLIRSATTPIVAGVGIN